MTQPELLMIDELSLGLAPVIVDRLVDVVGKICRERKISVLLVEQDLNVALATASRGYVLEHGRVVRTGSSQELYDDKAIRAAYLGI